ncbi:TerC family protein [Actinoallomurus purpureus]|uniref:TerC family protein n=1 Tax=Actinoallomurus purpureus TaxID=478114 RepID=UPI0020929724|nr:TerC family protein [Actinoallomurus purpureus]MCO6003706.1 TerC family protein [Actinoallomurus purpureus]
MGSVTGRVPPGHWDGEERAGQSDEQALRGDRRLDPGQRNADPGAGPPDRPRQEDVEPSVTVYLRGGIRRSTIGRKPDRPGTSSECSIVSTGTRLFWRQWVRDVRVPLYVWGITGAGIVVAVLVEVAIAARQERRGGRGAHDIAWLIGYVVIAVAFGAGLGAVGGGRRSVEFVTEYLTEYSLSVDLVLLFALAMSRFAVPRTYQARVLITGVGAAIVIRGGFIAIGVSAANRYSWLLYLGGAMFVWRAIIVLRESPHADEHENDEEHLPSRFRRLLVSEYHGSRLSVRMDGRRMLTPMAAVIATVAVTDVLFVPDSGTPYLVFMANVFALLILRQVYFLVVGHASLLQALILGRGAAMILTFLGGKLFVQALHSTGVSHIGPLPVPAGIAAQFTLSILATVIALNTLLRLRRLRRSPSRES